MSDLPIKIDAAGPAPYLSTELRETLVQKAQELSPGLTDNLPGSLVEDIVSTDVGALLMCDQARVDVLNSLGPRTANLHMLTQLAEQYGVPARREDGLTSVNVVFKGTPGFAIPQGFIVGDGIHQYGIEDATIIPSDGVTQPVTAYGLVSGQWAVAARSVNKLVTSVPGDISLSVDNPLDGVPAAPEESVYAFRERVWLAGMSNVTAYPGFIRAELSKVKNIVNRLTSVKLINNHWYVMCTGGDLYSMAGAIFKSAGDFTRLAAFELTISNITKGSPTTIETTYTHGLKTGDTVVLKGIVSLKELNDREFKITVINAHTFTVPYGTGSLNAKFDYTGYVTPNLRAHTVTITDWPDHYAIPFSEPLQQKLTIQYSWETNQSSYLSSGTILPLVQEPTRDYINSIGSGNAININTLKGIFMTQVNTITDANLVDVLDVVITSNGSAIAPENDDAVIHGDPFSYWYIEKDDIGVKNAS